jgi:hypothetical protein
MYRSNIYSSCIFFLILSIFIVSCSSKDISVNKKEVDEVSVFLKPDSSHVLAEPSSIKAVPGGILVYDLGTHQIYHFSSDGDRLLCFGRQGKGPGEYLNVNGMWKFKNEYLIYDRQNQKLIAYDLEGNHIKDIPVKLAEESQILPFKMEAISPVQLITSSGGENGSLIKWINIATDSIRFFGKKERVPDIVRHAPSKLLQALDFKAFENTRISYGSNRNGIFVFHDLSAKLEKYAFSGKLLWQKDIKVPAIQHLFRHIIQKDKARLNHGKFLLPLSYSMGMSVNEKGVAVLLNVLKKQPVTVVWILNNGRKITVVTFPGLKNPYPLSLKFALSKDGSAIYFVNVHNGKIYKADWPG